MALTLRQKHWLGALGSLPLTAAVFLSLAPFTLVGATAAVFGLCMALAASHRSSNPYLTGARWASFLNLSWTAYARHEAWYPYLMESMLRLSDYEHPLTWAQRLCGGDAGAATFTVTTSALIVLFYYQVSRWPEWTERWESVRRAPFSASFGLQVIICTAVIYPTPWTLAVSLCFAAVVSPLVRRQVRFNHIVFLSLFPLFALGSQPVALIAALIGGLLFIYFAAVERGLSTAMASFSFFSGITALALAVSITENYALSYMEGAPGGLFALACFFLNSFVAYRLFFRGEESWRWASSTLLRSTPARWRTASWWKVREQWVDREIDHRAQRRYRAAPPPRSLGTAIFGPQAWAPDSEAFPRKEFSPLNFAPAALVLSFYSIWLLLDAALELSFNSLGIISSLLVVGFGAVLVVPVGIIVREARRGTGRSMGNALGAMASTALLTIFMFQIFYFGLASTDGLNERRERAAASAAQTLSVDTPESCQAERWSEFKLFR